MYGVSLVRSAQKEFDVLTRAYREKVRRVIEDIAADPFQGKTLKGKLAGCYSVRAWPFRIVYQIRKKEVHIIVLAIRDRKDAYR